MSTDPPAPLLAVAGVVLHQEGRVLLQHRDDDPTIRWPGMWAIFGGHVEPGELPEDAARREIEEELGLVLAEPLALLVHRRDTDRERFVYATPLPVPISALRLMEGQAMGLFTAAELEELPVVPIHREILRSFLERPA